MQVKQKEIKKLLEIVFDTSSYKKPKRFALAIILLLVGIKIDMIATIVCISKRQVYRYKKQYETEGKAAITKDLRHRPVSELEAHRKILDEELEKRPPATAAEASERIFSLKGIKRCPTQIRKFLHKLNFKPQKVGMIPAKADLVKQREYHDNDLQPRMQEAVEGKRKFFFMDAAHFVWQAYLGTLWCKKRQFIQAPSGRERVNILGALDPVTKEVIKIITDTKTYINSFVVVELLEKIRAIYPEQAITIVLDNAKYQRCDFVTDRAKELNIELLFLPPYSPNLNLIERLWRFVKKEALYSKYHDSSLKFRTTIEEVLDSTATTRKEAMDTLMSMKFQLFDTKTDEKGNTWVRAA